MVRFRLHHLLLKPGAYLAGLWLGQGSVEDIDGITYFTQLQVDLRPEAIKHSEVFPGPYQCEFEHAIRLLD
jgi:hypothetical protein